MASPAISIVIPARDAARTIVRVLRALSAEQERVPYELIVVDDGSTDGTADVARDVGRTLGLPLRVLVQSPAKGPGAARNAGAADARAPILLFLGADIVPQPPFLLRHVAVHQQFPEETVGCLGFVTWDPDLPPTPFMVFLEQGGPQNAYGEIAGRAWVSPRSFFYGSNVSLKRSFFVRAGGFDATHFTGYGWEDLELGVRLERLGLQLAYEPAARGAHVHRVTLSDAEVRMRELGKSARTFFGLHPDVPVLRPERERVVGPLRRVLFPSPIRSALRRCARACERRYLLPFLYRRVLSLAFYNGVHA